MKERPILFSGPMVRAILEGKKTQTRRTVKPKVIPIVEECFRVNGRWCNHTFDYDLVELCPYGKPGDLLWVRETWKYLDWTTDGCPYIAYAACGTDTLKPVSDAWDERVEDIWAYLSRKENYSIDNCASDRRWRPSIHMPRWASRIDLEITGIRVERLQDISEEDARDEGVLAREEGSAHGCCYDGYREIWTSIHSPGSWKANPWVWVIKFRRI